MVASFFMVLIIGPMRLIFNIFMAVIYLLIKAGYAEERDSSFSKVEF